MNVLKYLSSTNTIGFSYFYNLLFIDKERLPKSYKFLHHPGMTEFDKALQY